jgi:hypothetical protein
MHVSTPVRAAPVPSSVGRCHFGVWRTRAPVSPALWLAPPSWRAPIFLACLAFLLCEVRRATAPAVGYRSLGGTDFSASAASFSACARRLQARRALIVRAAASRGFVTAMRRRTASSTG